MKKSVFTVITLALTILAFEAQGQLLNETFTYPDGPLVTRTGSPWTTSSGTAEQQNVVSGRLFLDDNETEDTRAFFTQAVTSGILSASFSLEIDTNDIPSSAAGAYFAHFIGDTDAIGTSSDFIGRVFTLTNPGGAAGTYRLGVSNSGNSASTILSASLTAGTVYSLTLSYDFGASQASLAVSGIGSVTATDTAAAITRIDSFAFRQTTSTGDQFIDNLTVVPEPTTGVMLLGGAGMLALLRRRRRC